MTKETLETAKYLEERIQEVQFEVDSIKKLDNLTKEVCIANFEHHVTIYLTAEEKALILPALFDRKNEELKLLQEEFERL